MEKATIPERFRPRRDASRTRPERRTERRRTEDFSNVARANKVASSGRSFAPTWARDGARRSLNVGVALLGIVVTAPLMAVIAILVRITSKGPILYKQKRVGIDRRSSASRNGKRGRRSQDRGGRLFTMYKFRTMHVGADQAGEVWARPKDPRVTPLGRVLRRYRLDELPQLFNVLKGDMNVVGPRPEQPDIFMGLREKVDGYSERQKVLPGITGLAQVRRPYDQSLSDVKAKVELDLDYMDRRCPSEDIRIMLETIPVMLGKKGSV